VGRNFACGFVVTWAIASANDRDGATVRQPKAAHLNNSSRRVIPRLGKFSCIESWCWLANVCIRILKVKVHVQTGAGSFTLQQKSNHATGGKSTPPPFEPLISGRLLSLTLSSVFLPNFLDAGSSDHHSRAPEP
jgi:hypothetical protein